MRPAHRRLAVLTALFALSLLSCGREVTGPDNGIQYGPRRAALALDPRMPSLFASLEGAGDVVQFENVWVVLRDSSGAVVFDSLVAFPVGADSVALTITLAIPQNAPAAGLPLSLTMAYVNATGDTVFRGGPAPVTAAPVGSSGSSQPITIPIVYDGVGKNATSVVLTPAVDTVVAGTSSTFTAIARDATNATIPLTPILFYTLDSTRASVPNVGVGSVTWLPSRGIARIVAALPDGQPSDTSYVMVKLPASQLVLGSGGGQSGTFGVALASPVVVRTLASDNVPVPGVIVTFAVATGGGSVATLVDTSDANGDASTSWTLGNTIGAQTITATAAGLTGSPLTITGTATAGAPFRVLITQQPTIATAGQTLTPSVVARVQDNAGNTVTTFTGPVTMVLDTGVAGALNGTTSRNAVAGVATFNDLSLTAIGMARIIASSGALLADESDSIAVGAGATARLEFIAQPTNAAAGSSIVPPVVVLARDAFGNPTPAFTGNVTIGINTGAGGAILGGTSTVAASAGVATFSSLTLDKVGAYTLLASGSALVPDTSASFSITAAGAAALQLVSGDAQTGVAGGTLTDSLVVRVVDAFANPVAGVQVEFATTSGSLSPDTVLTDVNGRASAAWTLGTTAGLRTAKATSAGLVDVTFSATATAGAATMLQIDAQPQDTLTAGIAGGSIVLSARDAFGNLVTTQPGSVNIGFTYNPQGGSIVSGSGLQAFAGGVATFTGIAIDKAGKYVMDFSSSGLSPAFSDTVTVVAGAASALVVVGGGSQTGIINTTLAQAIAVRVTDSFANPVAGHMVKFSILSGGGSVSPDSTPTDATGLATTAWTLGSALGSQQLNVNAGVAGGGVFSATATVGAPTAIEFQTAPQGAMIAGTPASNIVVAVKDALGNVVTSYSGYAKLSLLVQPVGATILAGGDSVAFVAGFATFPGLTLDKAGAYRLQFDAGAFAALLSDTITVSAGAADTIVMVSGNNQIGEPNTTLAAPVRVRVYDAYGNPVENVGVTYSVVSGDADPAITTVFTDSTGLSETEIVVHDSVGSLTIHAAVAGVNGSPVVFTATIQSASPTQVNLTASPTTSIAGNITSSFAVELRDAQNALATAYTDTVRFVVLVGPVGAPAGGKTKAVPVGGIVSFDDLSFNIRGAYQIGIVAAGVADTAFTTLTVTAANANAMAMSAGDGTTATVLSLLPQPMIVQITDLFGNPKPGVTVNWDVVAGDASVTNPTMVTDTNGYAFTSVQLGTTPGAIQVQASVGGLTGSPVTFNATSTAGAATHLRVETQPLGVAAGDTLAAFSVSARDSIGNLVTSFANTVSVTVDSGPAGSILLGVPSATAIGGIATFTTNSLFVAGEHRLRFVTGGLADTVSAKFTITSNVAAQVTLENGNAQSDTVTRTLAPLSVRVIDTWGNGVPGHPVAWSIQAGDAIVSDDTTFTDALGFASTLVTLGDTAGAVTIHATVAGLSGSPSVFSATATNDVLNGFDFTSAPTTGVAGATIGTFTIRAHDGYGNTIADFADAVTASVDGGVTGITGTLNKNFSGGTVDFDDLVINEAGAWNLKFTSGVYAPSSVITISAASAAALQFVLQPDLAAAGQVLSPITVRAVDALGNVVPAFDSVTISIDSSAAGAVLTGTLTRSGEFGLAIFNDIRINRTGVSRLRADWPGLISAVSDTFSQQAAQPDSIAMYAGNAQVDTVNSVVTNPLQVIVLDSMGNAVPNANVTWSVDSGYATLNDSTILTDSNGLSSVIVTLGDSIGPVYISATYGGLGGSPIQFLVVALNAPASRLVIDVDPSPAIAGSSLGGIAVSARDSVLNYAIDFSDNIVVSIDSGPVGAVLGGTTSVAATAGIAAFTDLTLDKIGNYRLRFTATGLADTVSIVFPVSPSFAENISYVSGTAQTDTAGRTLDSLLVVRVADGLGNPVAGQWVTWYSPTGGVTFAADSSVTDANGDATMSVTLGTVVSGVETMEAWVPGLTGSPVGFTATIVPDTLTQIVVMFSPDTTTSGATTNYYLQAQDQYGNIVTSCNCAVSVDITVGPSASFVSGTTSLNFTAGEVNFSDLVFGPVGLYGLRFSTASDTALFATVVIPGSGASFLVTGGDAQTEMANTLLDSVLVVRIQDANGNGRSGDTVTFTVIDGGGLFDNGFAIDTAVTDVNGYATAAWTLGATIGTQNAIASSTGFSDVNFTATATEMIANRVWTGAVDSDWDNGGNWKLGAVGQASDSVLVPAGRPNYPQLAVNKQIARVTIETGASIDLNSNVLIVSGAIDVPTASLSVPNGHVYATGTTSTIAGQFNRLRIVGTYTATAGLVTTDSLIVGNNAALDLGSFAHSVGTHLLTSGDWNIAQAAGGTLTVPGNARFDGSDVGGGLVGGRLYIGGNFEAVNSGTAFRADSAHTTILNGTTTQTVVFDAPDTGINTTCSSSCFGRLEIVKGTGDGAVIFNSHVKALGGILTIGDSLGATGYNIIAGGPSDFQSTYVSAARIAWKDALTRSGTFAVDTLVAFGNGGAIQSGESIPTIVVGSRTWTSPSAATTSMFVDGTLDIDGYVEHQGTMTLRGTGRVTMHDAGDTLIMGGLFTAGSDLGTDTTMTNGLLQLQGQFDQPQAGVSGFLASASHTTRILTPTIPMVFAGTGNTFGTFRVGNGTNLTITGNLAIQGDAIIEGTTGSASVGGSDAFVVAGDLIDSLGGRWDHLGIVLTKDFPVVPTSLERVTIQGQWYPTVATTIANNLIISADGVVSPNGGLLSVGALNVLENGSLIMDDAADTIIVTSDFFMNGSASASFSAGYTEFHAGFYQTQSAVFAAQFSHVSSFVGTGLSQVQFDNPGFVAGQSHFGEMRVMKSDGAHVQIISFVAASGQLTDNEANQQNISAPSYQRLMTTGAKVNDLVFDRVHWLVLDGTSADTIGNVRFQTMDADSVQLEITRQSGVVALVNPQWVTVPNVGGLYLKVNDTDAGSPLQVDVSNPTPQFAGLFAAVTNGAQILNWIDFPALNWSNGGGDQAWTNPLNWMEGRAPNASDSVIVGAAFSAGQMPSISAAPVFVRSLIQQNANPLLVYSQTLTVTSRLQLPYDTQGISCPDGSGSVNIQSIDSAFVSGYLHCDTRMISGLIKLVDSTWIDTLSVQGTSRLDINGQFLRTGGDFGVSGSASLEMTDAGGHLRLYGDSHFGGTTVASDLTDGTVTISGNMFQEGTGAGYATSGSHLTVLEYDPAYPTPLITFDDPSLSISQLVVNTTLSMLSNVNVAGNVRVDTLGAIAGTTRLAVGGDFSAAMPSTVVLKAVEVGGIFADSGTFNVDTTVFTGTGQAIPLEINEQDINYKSIRVSGTAVMVGATSMSYTLNNDLVITGSLSVPDSSTVVVMGNLSTLGNGTLVMNSSDQADLQVRGDAQFGGGSTAGALLYGTLTVGRSFVQSNANSDFSFAPAGNHVTVLDSTGTIQFATPGSSRFHVLRINSATNGSYTLNSDVVTYTFETDGESSDSVRLLAGAGYTTSSPAVSFWLTTFNENLVLENVRLRTEYGFYNPASVTFRNFGGSTSPQFEVTAPFNTIASGTMTFDSLQTTPLFVRVEDTNLLESPGDSAAFYAENVRPVIHGGNVEVVPGAKLLNWAAIPEFRWTGNVNNDWLTAGNWATNVIPSSSDSAYVPSTVSNAPHITSNLTIKTLVSDLASDSILVQGALLSITDKLIVPRTRGMYCTSGGSIEYVGFGTQTLSGSIGCPVLAQQGTVAAMDSTTINALNIQNTARVVVSSDTLTVEGNFTTGQSGQFQMNDDAALATVYGTALFNGGSSSGLLNRGRLRLANNLTAVTAGTFISTFLHTTEFFRVGEGGTPSINMGADPYTSRFKNVVFSAGNRSLISMLYADGAVTIDSGVTVNAGSYGIRMSLIDTLTIKTDATLSAGVVEIPWALKVTGNYNVAHTIFSGTEAKTVPALKTTGDTLFYQDVTVLGDWTFAGGTLARYMINGDFTVQDSGIARFGGAGATELIIAGNLLVEDSARVQMNFSSTLAQVGGDVTFGGASEAGLLTQGVISLRGNFTQAGDVEAYKPSAGHITSFEGTSAQTVDFQNSGAGSGTSHFGTLRLRPTSGTMSLVLQDPIFMTGSLFADTTASYPATISSASTQYIVSYGGHVIGGLTFDNTHWTILNPQPLDTLEGLTFTNITTDTLQLRIVRESGVVHLISPTFSTAGTAAFFRAEDFAGGGSPDLTIEVTNPSPAFHDFRAEAVGGFATINGWPSDVQFVWTGAVSTDWFTSGNWSMDTVPATADSVTIGAAATARPTIGNNLNVTVASLYNYSDSLPVVIGDSTTFTVGYGGHLLLPSGAPGITCSDSSRVFVGGSGGQPGTAKGWIDCRTFLYDAGVSIVDSLRVSRDLDIWAPVTFAPGGGLLRVNNDLSLSAGSLTTSHAADSIVVNGDFFVYSSLPSTFTDGLLRIDGDFVESGYSGHFKAEPGHVTQLYGTGLVRFDGGADTSSNYFGDVEVQTGTRSLATKTVAKGLFLVNGGAVVDSTGVLEVHGTFASTPGGTVDLPEVWVGGAFGYRGPMTNVDTVRFIGTAQEIPFDVFGTPIQYNNIVVSGSAFMQGTDSIGGYVNVKSGGLLRFGAPDTTTTIIIDKNLMTSSGGRIQMTDTATMVTVNEVIDLNGGPTTGLLTEGTLRGRLGFYASDTAFSASGNHKTDLLGCPMCEGSPQPLWATDSTQFNDLSISVWYNAPYGVRARNLHITNGSQLDSAAFVYLSGDLTGAGGTTEFKTTSLHVADSLGFDGIFDADTVVFTGVGQRVPARQPDGGLVFYQYLKVSGLAQTLMSSGDSIVVTQNLMMVGGGRLELGETATTSNVRINNSLVTEDSASIIMHVPTTHVHVMGQAYFAGGSTTGQLDGGHLYFYNTFNQFGINSTSSFQAEAAHYTHLMAQSSPKYINFDTDGFGPTDSRFGFLYLDSSVGDTIHTGSGFFARALLHNTLDTIAIAVNGGDKPRVTTRSLEFLGRVVFDKVQLDLQDGQLLTGNIPNMAFINQDPDSVAWRISRASATFAVDTLEFSTLPTTGRYLEMTDTDGGSDLVLTLDKVTPGFHLGFAVANNSASFVGWDSTGAFVFTGSGSFANAANWNVGLVPSATDSVYFDSTAAGNMSIDNPTTVGAFVMRGIGATLYLNDDLSVARGFSLRTGEVNCEGASVYVNNPGDTSHVSADLLDCPIVFTGGVAIMDTTSTFKEITVTGTGSLVLNSQRVTANEFFGTAAGGTLVMQTAADTLNVAGNIDFSGGSTTGLLTNGVLMVKGNFAVNSSDPTAFRATDAHTTVFRNASAPLDTMGIYFNNPGPQRFAFVRIDSTIRNLTSEMVMDSVLKLGEYGTLVGLDVRATGGLQTFPLSLIDVRRFALGGQWTVDSGVFMADTVHFLGTNGNGDQLVRAVREGGGAHQFESVVVMGDVKFYQNGADYQIANSLEIASGALKLRAATEGTVTVRADSAQFTVSGADAEIVMDSGAVLHVLNAVFADGTTDENDLVEGQLYVHRNFYAADGAFKAGAFLPESRRFEVVMVSDSGNITLENPAQDRFFDLVINTGSLTILGSDVYLDGQLRYGVYGDFGSGDQRVRADSTNVVAPRVIYALGGAVLPAVNTTHFGNVSLVVNGDGTGGIVEPVTINKVTWHSMFTQAVFLELQNLDGYRDANAINFDQINFNSGVTGIGRYFQIDNSDVQLTFSNSNPTIGCMLSLCAANSYEPGPPQLNTWTGLADDNWHNPSNWSLLVVPDENTDVAISNGPVSYEAQVTYAMAVARSITVGSDRVLTLNNDITVNGDIAVAGTVASSGGSLRQRPRDPLTNFGLSVPGIVSNYSTIAGPGGLAGWFEATTTVNVANSLNITAGRFNVNGQKVSAFTLNVNGTGQLQMSSGADSLVVSGTATFNGGSTAGLLTAGVLDVGGDLLQYAGGSPAAFAASNSHLTVLRGSTSQSVYLQDASLHPDSSHFGSVLAMPGIGIKSVASSMPLDGLFIASGNPVLQATSSGFVLSSSGGTTNGVTFDGLRWVINVGGPIGTLQGMTFASMPPWEDQLFINRQADTINIVDATFTPLNSGVDFGNYVVIYDGNAGDDLHVNFTNSSPAGHLNEFVDVFQATYSGWGEFLSHTFYGTIDGDPLNAGNWEHGVTPGTSDEVYVDNVSSGNTLSVNSDLTYRSLTAQPGSTLNLFDTLTVKQVLNIANAGSVSCSAFGIGFILATTNANGVLFGSNNNCMLTVTGADTTALVSSANWGYVYVRGSATLDLAGNSLSIGGVLQTTDGGRVKMTTSGDSLYVSGPVLFAGGNTTGMLEVGSMVFPSGLSIGNNAGAFASGPNLPVHIGNPDESGGTRDLYSAGEPTNYIGWMINHAGFTQVTGTVNIADSLIMNDTIANTIESHPSYGGNMRVGLVADGNDYGYVRAVDSARVTISRFALYGDQDVGFQFQPDTIDFLGTGINNNSGIQYMPAVTSDENDRSYKMLRVYGNVSYNQAMNAFGATSNRLEVLDNGVLSIGNMDDKVHLKVDTLLVTGANAFINMASDSALLVVDSIHWNSGQMSSFTAGEIQVREAWIQRNYGVFAGQYGFAPAFRMLFAPGSFGAAGKLIYDVEDPYNAALMNLRITGGTSGDTVTLASDLILNGLFKRDGAIDGPVVLRAANLAPGNSRLLRVGAGFNTGGGIDVNPTDHQVVFRNVRLQVDGDATSLIDANMLRWTADMDPDVTAFTLNAMDQGTKTFSNIQFFYALGTGKYFEYSGLSNSGTVTFSNPNPTVGCFILGCNPGDISPYAAEPNTWEGDNSGDWIDPLNWSAGHVPDFNSSVTIPSGTTYSPTINTSQLQTGYLEVQNGATLTFGGFEVLYVRESLNNAGDINGTSGLLVVGPSTPSSIEHTGSSFQPKLAIGPNLDGTVHEVTLVGNVFVDNQVEVSGRLNLNANTLYTPGNFSVTTSTGLLVMQNSSDYLVVGGNANFSGGQNTTGYLTDGEIDVSGNFTKSGGNQFAFSPSGNHLVTLGSNASNSIVSFSGAVGSSLFNRLNLQKFGGMNVQFTSSVYINEIDNWTNSTPISVSNGTVTVLGSVDPPGVGTSTVTLAINGFMTLAHLDYNDGFCGPIGQAGIVVLGTQVNFTPVECWSGAQQLVLFEQQGHQDQDEQHWESLRQYLFKD